MPDLVVDSDQLIAAGGECTDAAAAFGGDLARIQTLLAPAVAALDTIGSGDALAVALHAAGGALSACARAFDEFAGALVAAGQTHMAVDLALAGEADDHGWGTAPVVVPGRRLDTRW